MDVVRITNRDGAAAPGSFELRHYHPVSNGLPGVRARGTRLKVISGFGGTPATLGPRPGRGGTRRLDAVARPPFRGLAPLAERVALDR
jgi:hypothetical protein